MAYLRHWEPPSPTIVPETPWASPSFFRQNPKFAHSSAASFLQSPTIIPETSDIGSDHDEQTPSKKVGNASISLFPLSHIIQAIIKSDPACQDSLFPSKAPIGNLKESTTRSTVSFNGHEQDQERIFLNPPSNELSNRLPDKKRKRSNIISKSEDKSPNVITFPIYAGIPSSHVR